VIAAPILALCGLLAAVAPQDAFQDSLAATARGDYRLALSLVDSPEVDPGPRAQARLWAFYAGGLLDLALEEAEAGALAVPDDPWLHEQAVRVALSLHHPAAASAHLWAWEQHAGAGAAPEPALRARVIALQDSDARQAAGLERARWTALAILAACAGLIGILSRGERRA